MKKQVLTLAMCLALSATAAFALPTQNVSKKSVAPTKVTIPVKSTVKPCDKSTPAVGKPCEKMTKEEAKKAFEAKRAEMRHKMYTDLQFSEEQKAKAEALNCKTKEELKPLMKKVRSEAKKLQELKAKAASAEEICQQEKALKAAKKEIRKAMTDSKDAFTAIMTKEQKAKYESIIAQRKQKREEFKKEHKFDSHKNGKFAPKGKRGPKGCGGPCKLDPKGPRGPEMMGPPPMDDED